MDEFGLLWLSSVWFDEVDFLKCSRSASQLSFTKLLHLKSCFNCNEICIHLETLHLSLRWAIFTIKIGRIL